MKHPEKARARKEVARRFRAFFATLQAELTELALIGQADGKSPQWRRVKLLLMARALQQRVPRIPSPPSGALQDLDAAVAEFAAAVKALKVVAGAESSRFIREANQYVGKLRRLRGVRPADDEVHARELALIADHRARHDDRCGAQSVGYRFLRARGSCCGVVRHPLARLDPALDAPPHLVGACGEFRLQGREERAETPCDFLPGSDFVRVLHRRPLAR